MDDPRLPQPTRKHLQDLRETVFVSVASLWEIVLKYRLGKLKMPEPVEPFLMRQIEENRFEILTIHSHHVFQTLSLQTLHRDPFDRILVAQAQSENLTIISRDPDIKAYPVPVFWELT